MRVWLQRAGLTVLLLFLVAFTLVAALLGPYVKDDVELDHIVRAVALDWRDFGEEQARTRLQYELDRRQIGLQVADSDCVFEVPEPEWRVVRCAWSVDVEVPFVDNSIPLSFESEAEVAPDGDLR